MIVQYRFHTTNISSSKEKFFFCTYLCKSESPKKSINLLEATTKEKHFKKVALRGFCSSLVCLKPLTFATSTKAKAKTLLLHTPAFFGSQLHTFTCIKANQGCYFVAPLRKSFCSLTKQTTKAKRLGSQPLPRSGKNKNPFFSLYKQNKQIKQKLSNRINYTEYKYGSTFPLGKAIAPGIFPPASLELINDENKQKASKNLFWGALLFSRGDLAFINLCGLLSSLLKALHVCLFATLNNKRIVFVADQRPLVQEHQQTLLNYFISCQVNSFSTKMASKLPLLLPYSSTWQKERTFALAKAGKSSGCFARTSSFNLSKEKNRYSSYQQPQPVKSRQEPKDLQKSNPTIDAKDSQYTSFLESPVIKPSKAPFPGTSLASSTKNNENFCLPLFNGLGNKSESSKSGLADKTKIFACNTIDRFAPIKSNSAEVKKQFTLPLKKDKSVFWGPLLMTQFLNDYIIQEKQVQNHKNPLLSTIMPSSDHKLLDPLGKAKEPYSALQKQGRRSSSSSYGKQKVEDAAELPENISKTLKNLKKADLYLQTQPLFIKQIVKLVSKAAVRSSQWTATLAQPTNSWIGGFFSNSLASYRQNLSSATLFNIRMELRSKHISQLEAVSSKKNTTPLIGNSTIYTKKSEETLKSNRSKATNNKGGKKNKELLLEHSLLLEQKEFYEKDYKLREKGKEQIQALTALTDNLEWKAISGGPVARKNWVISSSVEKEKIYGFPNKPLLRNFWGLLKSKRLSNSIPFKKQKLHKKVLNNCAKLAFKNSKNAWLKEADLVFFTNPEKSQSLLSQINRLQIPTIGIVNSGSALSRGAFRSVKGHSILSNKPIINYPIIGNSNSLNFLRIILTKIASVLNH